MKQVTAAPERPPRRNDYTSSAFCTPRMVIDTVDCPRCAKIAFTRDSSLHRGAVHVARRREPAERSRSRSGVKSDQYRASLSSDRRARSVSTTSASADDRWHASWASRPHPSRARAPRKMRYFRVDHVADFHSIRGVVTSQLSHNMNPLSPRSHF